MADQTDDEPRTYDAERDAPPGTPRWVKLLLVVFVALSIVFVAFHLAGGGFGPGMHTPMEHGPPP